MSEYVNVIRDTLDKKETGYRYPGEILERCIVNTPEKAGEVLDGFLEFLSDTSALNELRNTENAFNSNQIDMFVEHIGNYNAVLLKFLLTKEPVGVKENYLKCVEDYIYLGKYIRTISDEETSEEIICELSEKFAEVIPLMIKTLYDGEFLCTIGDNIRIFNLDSKYQKEEKKYLNLIRKAADIVLSDADVIKLQSYGYSPLKIRKLNAVNLVSYVAGRKDRAWFLFLKEAFFGAEPLTEDEKEIISAKIKKECFDSYGRKEEWVLERAIDGHKSMLSALSYRTFKEDSANASYCLSFMSEDDYFDMARTLSLTGNVFNSLAEQQKIILYAEHIKRSDDNEKLRYCKEKVAGCDPEGKYLSRIYAKRLIVLVDKGILAIDELDNPNVELGDLLKESFKIASATTLEILKRYADKAPNLFDNLEGSYYHKDETNKIYLIKGEYLTENEIKELYKVKENYFFRCAPFVYVKFICSVITETKTLIHSKDEWLSLLDYLEETGCGTLSIKKELLSEEEYAEILRKIKEEQENQKRSSLMEQIKNATTANDIEWYQISKDMLDIKRAACLKILELKDYSTKAEDKITLAYYEDIISDEEFLAYHKGKKEFKKNKEVV